MDATELGVLNWTRLRELLAEYRTRKYPDIEPFAEAIGVHPSTVYRIENVKDDADYQPKLPTIVSWLDVTAGDLPLSQFFLQIESLQTLKDIEDNQRHHVLPVSDDERAISAKELAIVTERLDRAEEQVRYIAEQLSDANLAVKAAGRPNRTVKAPTKKNRGQAPGTHRATAKRARVDRDAAKQPPSGTKKTGRSSGKQ